MIEHDLDSEKGAIIDAEGTHRYVLWRKWGDGSRRVVFCMLNPSTADGMEDDPTIRRCIGYAVREGFDALDVINLYAYRATNPDDLLELCKEGRHDEMMGASNKLWMLDVMATAELVVVAWGAWRESVPRRWKPPMLNVPGFARDYGLPVRCFGTTAKGAPKHPLYLRLDQPLVPYRDLL